MSQDRNIEQDQGGVGPPTCSLDHALKARQNYCGTVRPAREPDEQGAVNVVETVFSGGERIAFFRIADSTLCEVRRLPAVHAARAQSVQPAPARQVLAAPRRRTADPSRPGPLFGGRE